MFKSFQWKIIEKILEEVKIGLAFIDTNGNMFYVNRLSAEILGLNRDANNTVLGCHSPNIHNAVINKIKSNNGQEWHRIILINDRYIENIYSPITVQGHFSGIVMLTRDVTEREEMVKLNKKALEKLRQSEECFRSLVDSIDDMIFTLDHGLRFNGVFGRWIYKNGLTADYFIGKGVNDIFGAEAIAVCEEACRRTLLGENTVFDWSNKKSNEIRYFQISLSPIRDSRGEVAGIVGVGRDITDRIKAEEMIKSLSYLDGLTGIPNRRYFDEQFDAEWRRALRHNTSISLIMCDIDCFKDYNDAYGHLSGDDCLRQVASTLSANLNRSGELVARYGGEEFAIVLPYSTLENAAILAEKLRSEIESLGIAHIESKVSRYITISLGVASIIPTRGLLFTSLISAADKALYMAKKEGRNRVKTYS